MEESYSDNQKTTEEIKSDINNLIEEFKINPESASKKLYAISERHSNLVEEEIKNKIGSCPGIKYREVEIEGYKNPSHDPRDYEYFEVADRDEALYLDSRHIEDLENDIAVLDFNEDALSRDKTQKELDEYLKKSPARFYRKTYEIQDFLDQLFHDAVNHKNNLASFWLFFFSNYATKHYNALIEAFPHFAKGVRELPVILTTHKVSNKNLLELPQKLKIDSGIPFVSDRKKQLQEGNELMNYIKYKIWYEEYFGESYFLDNVKNYRTMILASLKKTSPDTKKRIIEGTTVLKNYYNKLKSSSFNDDGSSVPKYRQKLMWRFIEKQAGKIIDRLAGVNSKKKS